MSFFENLRRQRFLSFTVVMLTLCVGILIGTVLNTGVKAAKDGSVAPGAAPLQVPPATQLQSAFATIAKMAEPSVVNISSEYVPKTTVSQRRNRRTPQDQDQDNGMEDFFQKFFGMPTPNGPSETPRGASLGSGFVVDRNGYILTNNHVVEHANRIRVKFNNDPTEYDAKVIGTDPQTDIAVIKIDKSGLQPVKIGNSDAIQVGDWAIAIGSPFGFQETVTSGIISAKSRDIPGDSTSFQHFLQTDAAINPGNSGGPLLNINGEVIGINTQIASRSGGFQGIGFAMPMNTAVGVYNQIIKNGKVVRGSIGIAFKPESQQTRDLLRAFHADHGIFVERVEPNGPADKAGLKATDIITAINSKPIKRGQDLIDTISETPVGSSVSVDFLRDGKPDATKVTIGDRAKIFPNEMQDAQSMGPGDEGDQGEATQARFGIAIQNLNDRLKQNMGVKDNGVLVQNVEQGSFADDIGLQQGDIITALNQKPVTGVDEFKRIQGSFKPGDAVAIRILRNTGNQQQPNWQSTYLAGSLPRNEQ